MTTEEIKKLIRDIPDFPQPGILFRDITPLISDARGLAAIVDQVAEPWLGKVDQSHLRPAVEVKKTGGRVANHRQPNISLDASGITRPFMQD